MFVFTARGSAAVAINDTRLDCVYVGRLTNEWNAFVLITGTSEVATCKHLLSDLET